MITCFEKLKRFLYLTIKNHELKTTKGMRSIKTIPFMTSDFAFQALHAEELSEVNSKLQALREDNQMLKEKQEALERDLSSAEDEMISLKRKLENMTNEKNELERSQEQLKKELEEQGQYQPLNNL